METANREHTVELIPFDDWLSRIGASRSSGWRYRKRGWIKVENRAGRLYVPADEAARFSDRQRNGEFARQLPAPEKLLRGRPHAPRRHNRIFLLLRKIFGG